jgi:hypothetical protein
MSDDPKLSQRYRELPREEPPRALDEAILAASRRAVDARPAPLVAPTGRRRWYFPVAAAAVIVLAVAVVAHVDREKPDIELATAPANVSEAPPPRPSAEEPKQAAKRARPQFAPDPRADSAAPAAEAPAPAAPPVAEARRERDASDRVTRAQAQGALSANLTQSPEQWLQRIADLRRQGRYEEADRELAQFRKRYPDYRLSDEMKAKVEKPQ